MNEVSNPCLRQAGLFDIQNVPIFQYYRQALDREYPWLQYLFNKYILPSDLDTTPGMYLKGN